MRLADTCARSIATSSVKLKREKKLHALVRRDFCAIVREKRRMVVLDAVLSHRTPVVGYNMFECISLGSSPGAAYAVQLTRNGPQGAAAERERHA